MESSDRQQHDRFLRLFVENEVALRGFVRSLVPTLEDAREVMQETAAVPVAKFVALHDCRWMNSSEQLATGDVIRIGQRIELSAGSAEVLFTTGAKLKIVGPAII